MMDELRGSGGRGRGAWLAVAFGVAALAGGSACFVGPSGPSAGCACDTTYGCDGCGCEPVQECFVGACTCDPTYGCDGCPCEPAGECLQGGSCICDVTYGCDGCGCEPVQECL